MIAFMLLFPMVFLSMTMTAFTAMLIAFSAVLTIAMGVFIGALIAYAAAFIGFMMIMFA